MSTKTLTSCPNISYISSYHWVNIAHHFSTLHSSHISRSHIICQFFESNSKINQKHNPFHGFTESIGSRCVSVHWHMFVQHVFQFIFCFHRHVRLLFILLFQKDSLCFVSLCPFITPFDMDQAVNSVVLFVVCVLYAAPYTSINTLIPRNFNVDWTIIVKICPLKNIEAAE